MKSHDHEARTKFEEFINNSTNAIECYSISGEWDYLIIFILENINEFHDFLMNNILQHKSVYNSSSHFALKRVKYSTSIPV
ncbi:Lrp/AsnC ligand binding domain-containing protein [Aquamicrobium sp.]